MGTIFGNTDCTKEQLIALQDQLVAAVSAVHTANQGIGEAVKEVKGILDDTPPEVVAVLVTLTSNFFAREWKLGKMVY